MLKFDPWGRVLNDPRILSGPSDEGKVTAPTGIRHPALQAEYCPFNDM